MYALYYISLYDVGAGAAHPYFRTIFLNMKHLHDPLHRPTLRDD